MGVNGSQPAHLVEVRIQQPNMATVSKGVNMHFFASVHSACDGPSEYVQWGEPQLMGLWADDVITISFFLAKSRKHFSSLVREELAETYLPWEAIEQVLRDGEEVTLCLALSRDAPWLQHTGTRDQYLHAFHQAYNWGSSEAPGPSVLIGLRPVQHVVPNMITSRSASPRDVGALESARSETRSLAAKMGLSATASPAPSGGVANGSRFPSRAAASPGGGEAAAQPPQPPPGGPTPPQQGEQVLSEEQLLRRKKMSEAMFENDRIRTELLTVQREFEMTSEALATQFPSALTASSPNEPAGSERDLAVLQAQVEQTNLENINFIRQFDEQIRLLEADLVDARVEAEEQVDLADVVESTIAQLDDQLQGLRGECEKLQVAVSHELERKTDAQKRLVQKLKLEHEVQLQELNTLRDLRDKRVEEFVSGTLPLQPPSTAVLVDEVSQLKAQMAQVELQGAKESNSLQRLKDELRHETRQLEEETASILAEIKTIDATVASIRNSVGTKSALEVEREQLRHRGDALAKEIGRTKQRLAIDEERIKHLRQEAENIRERAFFVSSSRDLRGTVESQSATAELTRRAEGLQRQVGLAQQLEQELLWEQSSLRDEIERLQVKQ